MLDTAAPADINTIKSLKIVRFNRKIINTDSEPLAPGAFMSDVFYVMPETREEILFIEKLIELIKIRKIKVLMPSSGSYIYPYGKYR